MFHFVELTASEPQIDVGLMQSWIDDLPRREAVRLIARYIRVTAHNAHAGEPDTLYTKAKIRSLRNHIARQIAEFGILQRRLKHITIEVRASYPSTS